MTEHASARAECMLTLIELTFAESEDYAHALRLQGYIVAPEAAQLLVEARRYLFCATPDLGKAMFALSLASRLEPLCYAQAHEALLSLALRASREVVDAELHAELHAERHPPLT